MKQPVKKARKTATKYADYSERTQTFMKAVEGHLTAKFGSIETQWEGILMLLANNYETFWKCAEKIKEDGLTVTDRFGAIVKHPLIKVQNDAQIQLVKLVNEFGISPKSIKNLSVTDTSEEDFINDLVG